ncbi:MAG TPA: hypothetical protein VF656_11505 [Pyrinomonadaceae bacterium]|jgi:hypothetical protein
MTASEVGDANKKSNESPNPADANRTAAMSRRLREARIEASFNLQSAENHTLRIVQVNRADDDIEFLTEHEQS